MTDSKEKSSPIAIASRAGGNLNAFAMFLQIESLEEMLFDTMRELPSFRRACAYFFWQAGGGFTLRAVLPLPPMRGFRMNANF
jgi:hypothetical protein